MKIYKREIQPVGLYDSENCTCSRVVPGFETWVPEEQEEELRKAILERYPTTFAKEYMTLIFDERFIEVEPTVLVYDGELNEKVRANLIER